MPRDEDQSNAATGVDEPCHGGNGSDCDYSVVGRPNHVVNRSIFGVSHFFDTQGRRLRCPLDALLLDISDIRKSTF